MKSAAISAAFSFVRRLENFVHQRQRRIPMCRRPWPRLGTETTRRHYRSRQQNDQDRSGVSQ
jgi:hypothetical protein